MGGPVALAVLVAGAFVVVVPVLAVEMVEAAPSPVTLVRSTVAPGPCRAWSRPRPHRLTDALAKSSVRWRMDSSRDSTAVPFTTPGSMPLRTLTRPLQPSGTRGLPDSGARRRTLPDGLGLVAKSTTGINGPWSRTYSFMHCDKAVFRANNR